MFDFLGSIAFLLLAALFMSVMHSIIDHADKEKARRDLEKALERWRKEHPLGPCKFCGGDPGYQSYPREEIVYTLLKCTRCYSQTRAFSNKGLAERAWRQGEYTSNA